MYETPVRKVFNLPSYEHPILILLGSFTRSWLSSNTLILGFLDFVRQTKQWKIEELIG